MNALAKQSHAPQAIGDSYVMRALALAGWTPRLGTCVVCGKAEPAYLSIASGGVMCEADHTTDARRIAPFVLNQFDALIRAIGRCLMPRLWSGLCRSWLKIGGSITSNARFVRCA